MSVHVGIIGGGPVGSLVACLLKTLCPELKVHVFEQRSSFTRDQIIIINDLSILPDKVVDALLPKGCFVDRPSSDTTAKCYRSPTEAMLFSIKISLLEKALWKHAKSIGVVTHQPKSGKKPISIDDPQLEKFDVLIGAGGKNDIIRDNLGFKVKEEHISYAVVMTWDRHDKRRSIEVARKRGNQSESSTQNRYRMFRSPKTNYYASIQLTAKEAKHLMTKKDLSWESLDRNTKKSFDSVFKYYNIKDDEFQPKESQMNIFPITLYQSNGYVGVGTLPHGKNKKLMIAIGDAINGVHFFSGTGVNTGFKMAFLASKTLCDFFYDNITLDKLISILNRQFKNYIKESEKVSRQVILNAKGLGVCNHESMKELKALAKERNYRAINNIPKHELCLIMAKEFY